MRSAAYGRHLWVPARRPEAGARCGSAARRDLCGGHRVTGVPTATQNPTPGTPWPRFNAKSYTRMINYDTASMRDEIVRTQAEPGARVGGFPLAGEQRQILVVSGTYAWSQTGETTTPQLAAVTDRRYQLWITPPRVPHARRK